MDEGYRKIKKEDDIDNDNDPVVEVNKDAEYVNINKGMEDTKAISNKIHVKYPALNNYNIDLHENIR